MGDEPHFVHITNGAKVNVRSGPSTGYKSIGQVKPGDDFPFLAWEDGWFQIELDDGARGYVAEEMGQVEDLGATPWRWILCGDIRTMCLAACPG